MRRLTLRARLTLIYGGLFLLAGLLLLGLTYILLERNLPAGQTISFDTIGPASDQPDDAPLVTSGGETIEPNELTGLVNTEVSNVRSNALTYLLTQGGIALLVVGAVAVALGWLVAGRVLAPLGRITDTARRIATAPAADRGLHERIALAGPPDELRQLADTFDSMLERLDHAFDGQRRFVANASHELRTPLTLNRSLVEVAMRRRSASEDVQRLGEVLLDVNSRQERLINGLLLLARSETELTNRSPVDLADVVAHVTQQVAPAAAAAGVQVTTDTSAATVEGDPVLLERLVQNLIENGIRHNLDGGWVSVTTGPGARLVVSNTGPVVPPYEIPVLFEPFHRLRDERPRDEAGPGAGLGLSIVRAVAGAHGGGVIAAPREGGGLIVTVTVPPAADADHRGAGDPAQAT